MSLDTIRAAAEILDLANYAQASLDKLQAYKKNQGSANPLVQPQEVERAAAYESVQAIAKDLKVISEEVLDSMQERIRVLPNFVKPSIG